MFWVLLLLPAWAFAGVACTRLCLAAVRAAAWERDAPAPDRGRELTLYEAAFLAGGPARVADLTMVAMARRRRLLLAHTGWATVVDPCGRDEMERSVIRAVGPGGQSRIAPVRAAAARAAAVRQLADGLVRAGLAVPDGGGTTVAAGVRQVRAAVPAVLALGLTALLTPVDADVPRTLIALWFALPLVLCLSCLAITRFEARPGGHWASPAGERLLAALTRQPPDGDPRFGARADDDAGTGERSFLLHVAVRGVRAIGGPELRAAFAHRDRPPRE